MSARDRRGRFLRLRHSCVYCGLSAPAPGACVAHSDLPALDPRYSERAVIALASELVTELDYTRPYPVASEMAP